MNTWGKFTEKNAAQLLDKAEDGIQKLRRRLGAKTKSKSEMDESDEERMDNESLTH